ncbi:uncharacterized protein AMSG_02348 [Thecamonas trahens ATCC 50062]|uniref:Uncharacterized protein n=1 Tax=Thecamonas trahens ATCC 50062 TaxID=461836 RepID=A0A0L0DXW9_THETB|nr:hypothetical protein AMSG_02348 [Thecamonas trahens ATCC 50062]KNC56378.1 hypothetical protein AMSG_02348 [Thecamonas trahens ATCC 50062]|eukprot:XP_013760893.1 hypothetical protein AMSG_02348 [Thecamonas trahens ATCC 50062]
MARSLDAAFEEALRAGEAEEDVGVFGSPGTDLVSTAAVLAEARAASGRSAVEGSEDEETSGEGQEEEGDAKIAHGHALPYAPSPAHFQDEVALRREVSRLNALLYANELTFQRTLSQNDKLREQLAQAAREVTEAQSAAGAAKEELMLFQTRNATPPGVALTELRGRQLQMVTIERDQLRMHVAARDETVSQLRMQVGLIHDERMDQIVALEREIERLNQSLASAAVLAKSRGARADKLAAQLATLSREADERVYNAEQRAALETAKLRELRSEVEAESARAAAAEARAETYAARSCDAEATAAALQASATALRADLDEARRQLDTVSGGHALAEMAAAFDARLDELQGELAAARRGASGMIAQAGEEAGDDAGGEAEKSFVQDLGAYLAPALFELGGDETEVGADETQAVVQPDETSQSISFSGRTVFEQPAVAEAAAQTEATDRRESETQTEEQVEAVAQASAKASPQLAAAIAEVRSLTNTNARLVHELHTAQAEVRSARAGHDTALDEMRRSLEAVEARLADMAAAYTELRDEHSALQHRHALLSEKHHATLEQHREALLALKDSAPHIAFETLREEIVALHASYVRDKRALERKLRKRSAAGGPGVRDVVPDDVEPWANESHELDTTAGLDHTAFLIRPSPSPVR